VKIGELQVCDGLIQKFYLMLLLGACFNLIHVPHANATENIIENVIDIDTSETPIRSFEQLCDLVGGFDIRPILTKNRMQDSTLVGKKLYARCLRDFTTDVLRNFLANLSERTLPLVADFLRAVSRVQQAAELLKEDGINDWFDFFKKSLTTKCKKYNFADQVFDEDLSLAFYRAARPTKPQLSGATSPLPPISSEMQAAIQETVNYINQQGSLSLDRLLVTDKAIVNLMEAQAIFLPTEGYPTAAANAATKKYVDEVAQGLHVKAACRLASTDAICVGGAKPSGPHDIDGYAVVAGNRILLKNEIGDAQKWNGIWLSDIDGEWIRPDDFKAGMSAAGAFVFVTQGIVNADTGWVCTTDKPNDIVNTDPILFTQFAGPGSITMENVGDGTGEVYKNRVGSIYYLRKLKDGANIAVTTSGDNVTVATTTDVNIAGTLNSTGDFSVATNKLLVSAASGQTTLSGVNANLVLKNSSGDITCTIASETGNICSCGQIAGAQSSCSASDARIKTDVKNLEPVICLEKINKLRPVAFKFTKEWREKNHQEEKINVGLIAQEVAQIVPEIVREKDFPTGDTISMVSYEQLIPYLIGSVHELTREVAVLRAQLAGRDKK